MRGKFDSGKPWSNLVSEWIEFNILEPITDPLSADAVTLATVPDTDPAQYKLDLQKSIMGSGNQFWFAFTKVAGSEAGNTLTVKLWYSSADPLSPAYENWYLVGSTGAMVAKQIYTISGVLSGIYRLTVEFSVPGELTPDYDLLVCHIKHLNQ